MIIWGGYNGGYLNDGGRYILAANSWTALNPTGAPSPRDYHTAVWTGSEMIVWGGRNANTWFNTTFSCTLGRLMFLYQRL